MERLQNIEIPGPHSRPIVVDIALPEQTIHPKPVVLFVHGFKGYKDWGHFPLMDKPITDAGFVFVRINFSHNGTSPERPNEFVDLEAFGQNNYSIELNDLGRVMDRLNGENSPLPHGYGDPSRFYLIGHSRGGGIAILKAALDERIKKLVTWAAVSDFEGRYPEKMLENWAKEGVIYIKNSRTGQDMPLYYQSVEDFRKHRERLSIPLKTPLVEIPWLIVHGRQDESVPVEEAYQLQEWNPNTRLEIIEGAGHTFGGYEPYDKEELPPAAKTVKDLTLNFLQ